ncbi:MAG: ATP-binding cassette domain-containing protein [Candidatus Heimdallarchaeota archaeon]|nr:ATP-binding cassette domain-containing protein [Candidatus Heimdallarchaeota archaeon]
MSDIAVKLENVSRDFGNIRAVNNLTLEIFEGEIFGLVGPNGAGKTTTIRMILGMLPPTEGTVEVLGYPIPKEQRKILHTIGYLAQQRALYESLTAQENIEFFAGIKGMAKKAIKEKTKELISILDLEEFANIQVAKLSGGTQQRVALATACVNSPRLLILDEATIGIDPILRYEIWDYLRTFNQEVKGAIIITTHILEEAEYADRVCFLRDAEKIALDTPDVLKKQTTSRHMEEVFLKLIKEDYSCA